MRSLEQALYDHELIVLRVIGEWWELDLTGSEKASCVAELQQTLSSLDMAREINFLPLEDAKALADLGAQGGRIPVAAFARDFGDVRLMGPGRLEREEPWLDPTSPAEALWYRGVLYRGFDETSEGVLEYYYLPQELMTGFTQLAEETPVKEKPRHAVIAVPAPKGWLEEKSDIVDDLTTVLALAQQGIIQPGNQEWTRFLINPAAASPRAPARAACGCLRPRPRLPTASRTAGSYGGSRCVAGPARHRMLRGPFPVLRASDT